MVMRSITMSSKVAMKHCPSRVIHGVDKRWRGGWEVSVRDRCALKWGALVVAVQEGSC